MNFQSIGRICQIVRHHRFSQLRLRVVTRVRRTLFDKFRAKRFPSVIDSPAIRQGVDWSGLIERHVATSNHQNTDWLNGDFEFLEDRRRIGMPPSWTMASHDVSTLWRFHLHYQDYLLDAFDGNRLDERAWETVLDWIDNYPIHSIQATSDGWHPFCISKRLVNWVILWCLEPPSDRGADVLGSIASQADFLRSHRELDLGGNHLIENSHALAVVSRFFENGERWAAVANETVQTELNEQFLPHGEHFERSPMYHKHMIVALLDIRDTIREFCPATARRCDETAQKAIDFLGTICHQDGEIPLLSDAVLDDGPSAQALVKNASPQIGTIKTGGYWVYEDNDSKVLFDRGPAGPDHLMGHAHADLLNVVCSIHGQRWIVDSGVFDYADSEMRQHCRSSAAHNVLEVDGENQFDMWSGFRVGRRGKPLLADEGSLAAGAGLDEWAMATHDAYRHRKLNVGRWIACGPLSICCVDWIDGPSRRRDHRLVSRIHLHPSLVVEMVGNEVTLTSPNAKALTLKVWALNGDISIRDGWYCPGFGKRERNRVIEISNNSSVPGGLGWLMSQSLMSPPLIAQPMISQPRTLTLETNRRDWRLIDAADEEVFRHAFTG